MQIIVKNYAHHNRSLPNWDTPKGKWIKSKDHYDYEMKKAGMVSYEKAKEMATGGKRKEYELSQKAKDIIRSAKNNTDRKGNVRLNQRTIEAMKEIGAIAKPKPKNVALPDNFKSGGFK